MQLLIRLPEDDSARQRVLAALPPADEAAAYVVAERDETRPCDLAIGEMAELASVESAVALQLAETSAMSNEPGSRFLLSRDAPAETWRLALSMALEIARLARRAELSDQAADEYFDQAHTDPLTGLANRRGWDRLAAQHESDEAACCFIVDIDDFKECNDRSGHEFGDRVLKAAAEALRDNLRLHDHIARIGGDEFAGWLPQLAPENAERVVTRIRENVVQQMRAVLGDDAPTVSLGAAAGVNASLKQILDRADQALLAAKRAGRNQSRVVK